MKRKLFLYFAGITLAVHCSSTYAQFWQIRNAPLLGESPGTGFGSSVSLSSDGLTLAASGSSNSEAGANTGHTQVFTWNGTNWIQKGTDIDGINAGELSGTDIALSGDGNTVIIGISYSEASWQSIGKIRVYGWNGIDWELKGEAISGAPDDENFGNSVTINYDGTVIGVSTPRSNVSAPGAGTAKVYYWNGNEWIQKGNAFLGTTENEEYGLNVEMDASGNRIVVSSNKSGNGQVFVYQWQDTSWVQVGQTLEPPVNVYNFGWSVDISATGQSIVVGAIQNLSQPILAGKTYVFDLNNGSWVQRGNAITGEDAQDNSGYSVAISDYGEAVAIGSPENDDVATNSGSVRVFRWNGNAWVIQGVNIDGEQDDDYYGLVVALSGDGTVVAVSASGNDSGGNAAGLVKVFEAANAGVSESVHDLFSLSPNPATDLVTLTSKNGQGITAVSVKDIAGKIISEAIFTETTEVIVPMPDLSGTYLLTVQTNGSLYTTRVVKQ